MRVMKIEDMLTHKLIAMFERFGKAKETSLMFDFF
jgi:hypothetical protein